MAEADGVYNSTINRSGPPLLDLVDDQWATDVLSDDGKQRALQRFRSPPPTMCGGGLVFGGLNRWICF